MQINRCLFSMGEMLSPFCYFTKYFLKTTSIERIEQASHRMNKQNLNNYLLKLFNSRTTPIIKDKTNNGLFVGRKELGSNHRYLLVWLLKQ